MAHHCILSLETNVQQSEATLCKLKKLNLPIMLYLSLFSQKMSNFFSEREIELIAFTPGFITWSNLRCFALFRAWWWIIQWSFMVLTLLQINVDNPFCPSVIIPLTLLYSSFISSTAALAETNKSVPLVWPLRLWRSSSSSVTFMSTPLKKSVAMQCLIHLCLHCRLRKNDQESFPLSPSCLLSIW